MPVDDSVSGADRTLEMCYRQDKRCVVGRRSAPRRLYRSLLRIVSTLGVIHFCISSVWWCCFIYCFHDTISDLPLERFLAQVAAPIGECILLTSGFVVAALLAWWNRRCAMTVLLGMTAVAVGAFLRDVRSCRAQIHVLWSEAPTNDFYATWWLYSSMARWSSTVGYTLAVVLGVCIAGGIYCWSMYAGRCWRSRS